MERPMVAVMAQLDEGRAVVPGNVDYRKGDLLAVLDQHTAYHTTVADVHHGKVRELVDPMGVLEELHLRGHEELTLAHPVTVVTWGVV